MSNEHRRRLIGGYFFAIGATALWSGNFIVARGLTESIPPVSLAFFRWLVAVAALCPFAIRHVWRERQILRDNIGYLSVTAFLGVTIFNTLIYYAGHTTSAVNLSLISISFPIFIVILSRILYSEPITASRGIGILVVVAGVLLLITRGALSNLLDLSFAPGDVWMLTAALTFAVYSILVKNKPEQLSVWAFQLSTFMLGLLFLLPFFIWEQTTVPIPPLDATTISAIFYVGIFASLAAFVLWHKAILAIGPSRAGMIYYTLPVFSGILAYIFLAEAVGWIHLCSVLLIVSGIVTANRTPRIGKN